MTYSSRLGCTVSGNCQPLTWLLFILIVCSVVKRLRVTAATDANLCSFSPPENRISITNVTEDWPVGSVLKQLSIVGNDSQVLLDVRPSYFYVALNQTMRTLIVTRRLEVPPNYASDRYTDEFGILCTVNSTKFTILTPVYLTVFDVNDHPPIFNSSYYNISVSETAAIGTVVATVWATDLDPSDAGLLVYSIDPNSSLYASYFNVRLSSVGGATANQIVCDIILLSPLSYQETKSINLTIIVKDNSNNHTVLGQFQPQFNSSAVLMVNVVPSMDNNPVFTRRIYTASIDRRSPQGSNLTVVPIIDAFSPNALPGVQLLYSIVQDSTNDDTKYFTINRINGVITLTSPFNADTSSLLAFQIQVTEVTNSRRYSSSLVKVSVTDDQAPFTTLPPPTFNQPVYNVTMSADSPPGSLVVVLSVTNSCSYWPRNASSSLISFSFNDPINDNFVIDPQTGEIRTARSLNVDVTSNYVLNVRVTDGRWIANASVFIKVLPSAKIEKSGPSFARKLYTFNAARNSDIIGSLAVSNSDPTANISFSIVYIDPASSSLFNISADGLLRWWSLEDALNSKEIKYILMVVATSSRDTSLTDTAVAVINLPSVDDFTAWISSSTFSTVTSKDQPQPSTSGSQNNYAIATIVLSIICAILLILVVGFFIFYCQSRSSSPKETMKNSRNDVHRGNIYENGFRVTDDFHGLTFATPPGDGESSTDVTGVASGHHSAHGGGKSPISSASSRLNENSRSLDGSKTSVKTTPGYGNSSLGSHVSAMDEALESPGSRRPIAVDDSRPAAIGMDPDVISSTETLMGPTQPSKMMTANTFRSVTGPGQPPPYSASGPLSFIGSNQSSLYMSSPDGSMMSVATQAKSDDGTGITVYY